MAVEPEATAGPEERVGAEAQAGPDEEVSALWSRFSNSRDPGARELLITHYSAVARTIAATLYGTRPDDSVPFDDYLQYARVGLIEAIDRYDTLRGASFETYSSYRIRGAVLNGLARETEARASRSRLAARLAEREESIAAAMLAHPESASLEDFVQLSVGLAIGFVLDEVAAEPSDESADANPYAQVEAAQLRSRVRTLIEQLPAREREVMRRHYYEQREFQDVAEDLGISKGRVSQLHARALDRVREWLSARPKFDRNL